VTFAAAVCDDRFTSSPTVRAASCPQRPQSAAADPAKMSRSGAPPQAEVTKSAWSAAPASTNAMSPGARLAGRPVLDLKARRFQRRLDGVVAGLGAQKQLFGLVQQDRVAVRR